MCLSKQTKSWDCSTALWSLVQVCHISIFVNFCFGINKAVIFLVGIISYCSCRILLQGLRYGFKFSHCWRSCDGLSLLTTSSLQLWCRSGNHLTSPAGLFFWQVSEALMLYIYVSVSEYVSVCKRDGCSTFISILYFCLWPHLCLIKM